MQKIWKNSIMTLQVVSDPAWNARRLDCRRICLANSGMSRHLAFWKSTKRSANCCNCHHTTIHSKKDKRDVLYHRDISLLSLTGKFRAMVIHKRCCKKFEPKLEVTQWAFVRPVTLHTMFSFSNKYFSVTSWEYDKNISSYSFSTSRKHTTGHHRWRNRGGGTCA